MMKKLLAVVLALTLALGMTTVAFAASKTGYISINDEEVYTYDSDSKTMKKVDKYEPGKTYYIPVWNEDKEYNNNNNNITSTSALSEYKLRRSIDEGTKVISGVQFVIKNVDKINEKDIKDVKTVSSNKLAFICITTKDIFFFRRH